MLLLSSDDLIEPGTPGVEALPPRVLLAVGGLRGEEGEAEAAAIEGFVVLSSAAVRAAEAQQSVPCTLQDLPPHLINFWLSRRGLVAPDGSALETD
jgi:hypothetical protein